MKRTLVFTATYNESGNIEKLIGEIFSYAPVADVLVVDDASPDGTGVILDSLARAERRITVIHRYAKLGLGSAHSLAMQYAVANGYDVLVTLDADFSHNPRYLPQMLAELETHEFVIGSRYMPGGSTEYCFVRNFLSRSANLAARTVVGVLLSEYTTAYRGYRIALLRQLVKKNIRSEGYSFFVESLFFIARIGCAMKEIPIHFEERYKGDSKISKREIIKGVLCVGRLFLHRLFRKKDEILDDGAERTHDVCMGCGSPFRMTLFGSRRKAGDRQFVHQCTAAVHGSHGRIVRCLQCGLVYQENRPEKDVLQDVYAGVSDERYAEESLFRQLTFATNFAKVRSFLPQSGKVLDIGAYCGYFLAVARQAGYDVEGIEPSRWAVDYARSRLGISIMHGSVEDELPRMGRYDVITMWDVLEHVHDPFQTMQLIAAHVKPDGIFAFSTLVLDNYYARLMGKWWPWLLDMHLYYFNKKLMRHLLERAGFECLRVESYTHVVSCDYVLYKLAGMKIPGAKFLRAIVSRTPLKAIAIPFSFGDICLFVARKK